MKKLLLFTVYCSLFTGIALGYSSLDVSNATYLADEGLIVKQFSNAKYRLDDTITRAEVVGIALKIKGITLPEKYTCKNYFSDVKYDAKNNWVCRAVEMAADNDLVTRVNSIFRPKNNITRAEALAILMKGAGIQIQTNSNFIGKEIMYKDANDWQSRMLSTGVAHGIIFAYTCGMNDNTSGPCNGFWSPNRDATRAEIFEFAKIILGTDAQKTYTNTDYGFEFSVPSSFIVTEPAVDGSIGISKTRMLSEIRIFPFHNNQKKDIQEWFYSEFGTINTKDCEFLTSNIAIQDSHTVLVDTSSLELQCDAKGYFTISPDKETIIWWAFGHDPIGSEYLIDSFRFIN